MDEFQSKPVRPLTFLESLWALLLAMSVILPAAYINGKLDFYQLNVFKSNDESQLFPDKKGFIVNLSNKISDEDLAQINNELENYYKRSGNTFLMLVTDNLGNYSIEEFANKLFKKWKPGTLKSDNGLILVISPQLKKARLEVGLGLEGTIPDVIAKRIISSAGKNYFASQDYREGLSFIIKSIEAKAEIYIEKSAMGKFSNFFNIQGIPLSFSLITFFLFIFIVPRPSKWSFVVYEIVFFIYGILLEQCFVVYGLGAIFAAFLILSSLKNNTVFFIPNENLKEDLTNFMRKKDVSNVGNLDSDNSLGSSTDNSWSSGSSSSSSSSGDSGGSSGGGGASSDW